MNGSNGTKGWLQRNLHITHHMERQLQIVNGRYSSNKLLAQSAPFAWAKIRDTWVRARKELAEDQSIPAPARLELLAQLDKDARGVLVVALESAQAAAENWKDGLRLEPRKIPDSTHERIWRQQQRLLDAGIPLSDLISRANADELAVLASEAPSIIESRTLGDPSMRGALTREITESLDKRSREIAPPEEQRRYAELDNLRDGLYRTVIGAKHLDHAIAQGDTEWIPIPAWGDGLVEPAPAPAEGWLGSDGRVAQ